MKNRTKIMTILLGLMILIPSICSAAYLGSEIPISNEVFNQQNPYVVFLPDKNLFFVVWEDWRNQLSTGADIYGRFLKSDGSFCGNEFIVSNGIGNQTAPVAAYRDGAIQNRSSNLSDKILVVWQDTRRTSTNGLIYYRSIDVSNISENCSNYSLGSETAVLLEDDEPLIPGIQSKANSRVAPKMTYDVINDRFVIAWVESRTTLKTSKFQPFSLNLAKPSWEFGDTQFVGYTAIRGDISGYQTSPTIIQQWMDNGAIDTFSRARLLNRGSEAMKVISVYEFFDSISNVDVSCDTTTPECLFVWEGKRGLFTRTDECTNEPKDENDNICDEDDSVSSKAETRYEPFNREIFGIFEKSIPLNVINATQISNRSGSASEAFMPSIGFDPISKRFLVVWEDTRDNGIYKKIYGQLVYSGSGLYNSNFLISFQDTDGDGKQDTNVANSKQTNPFVSYDAVNQRFFVVWQDGRNSTLSLENLDIYGQKVDTEGSLRGNNFAVYNLPYNQLAPVIANNPIMDEFIAVWKDARNTDNRTCGNGGQPCGSDVFGQLFTLGQPAIILLNLDNTPLSPAVLQNFENPQGSGSVKIGSFAAQSFKIRNAGDVLLKIDYVDLTCGGIQSEIVPFSLEGLPPALADRDGSTVDIVPSAELKFTVIFKPLQPGTYNKCFIIESDGGRVKINLSAYAIESRKGINVNPEIINFPATTVDSSSTQTLTITNTGSFDLIISNIINPTGDFRISDSTCSGRLKPDESCEITISFNPKTAGFQQSVLLIKSNDPEIPSLDILITGVGRASTQKINILPVILDFGTINRGSQKTDIITIQNNGGQNLLIRSISYPKLPFTVSGDNCSGQTLEPGASCDINITFSPRYRGKYSSGLIIRSNDTKRPKVKVKLKGIATL
jgi:hypothetical protein